MYIMIEKLGFSETWTVDLPIFSPDALYTLCHQDIWAPTISLSD